MGNSTIVPDTTTFKLNPRQDGCQSQFTIKNPFDKDSLIFRIRVSDAKKYKFNVRYGILSKGESQNICVETKVVSDQIELNEDDI